MNGTAVATAIAAGAAGAAAGAQHATCLMSLFIFSFFVVLLLSVLKIHIYFHTCLNRS